MRRPVEPISDFERLTGQKPPDPDFRRLMERPVSPRGAAAAEVAAVAARVLGRLGGIFGVMVPGYTGPAGTGELGERELKELARDRVRQRAEVAARRIIDRISDFGTGGPPEPEADVEEIENIIVKGKRTTLPKPKPPKPPKIGKVKWPQTQNPFAILPRVSARKQTRPAPVARTMSGWQALSTALPSNLTNLLPGLKTVTSPAVGNALQALGSLVSAAGGGRASVDLGGMKCSCSMPSRKKPKKKKNDKKKCDPCQQARVQGKANSNLMNDIVKVIKAGLTRSNTGGVASAPGKKRTKGKF